MLHAEATTGTAADDASTRSWAVSRTRCGAYAIGVPVAIGVVSAIVARVTLGEEPSGAGEPVDPVLLIGTLVVFGVGISLLALREFLPLALLGGGLTAGPDGLEVRLGRRGMLLRWSWVERVAAEARSDTRGRGYEVLAIRFAGPGFSWPRLFSLWFSTRTCLCISPLILREPVAVVATGVEEARRRFVGAGSAFAGPAPERDASPRYAQPLPRPDSRRLRSRAVLKARLVACMTFFFTLVSAYWSVQALLKLDLIGLLGWTAFVIGTAVAGLGLWFFGAETFFED
jgi:hypothetical protein